IELTPQTLIASRLLAGPCRDLKETDLPAVLGILREQPAECFEPVDQTLGVVQAIHADCQSPPAKTFAQPCRLDTSFRPGGSFREPRRIDADGINDRLYEAAFVKEAAIAHTDPWQQLTHAVQEGALIGARMKPDDIVSADAAQQLCGAWQRV